MVDYTHDRFPGPDPYAALGEKASFSLTSPDLVCGTELPEKLRAPQSISPELHWQGAPGATQSYAVTCLDPDAPTGSGFWHWAAFDIPASVYELAANAGSQYDLGVGALSLRNDSGGWEHYGAAPPAGHAPHRYLYVVHALDVAHLEVSPEATPAVLGFNLYSHTLGRAVLWGWYQNIKEN